MLNNIKLYPVISTYKGKLEQIRGNSFKDEVNDLAVGGRTADQV